LAAVADQWLPAAVMREVQQLQEHVEMLLLQIQVELRALIQEHHQTVTELLEQMVVQEVQLVLLGMDIQDLVFSQTHPLEALSLGQMECSVEIYQPMVLVVLAAAVVAECTADPAVADIRAVAQTHDMRMAVEAALTILALIRLKH
jgi:hypothetical protein